MPQQQKKWPQQVHNKSTADYDDNICDYLWFIIYEKESKKSLQATTKGEALLWLL